MVGVSSILISLTISSAFLIHISSTKRIKAQEKTSSTKEGKLLRYAVYDAGVFKSHYEIPGKNEFRRESDEPKSSTSGNAKSHTVRHHHRVRQQPTRMVSSRTFVSAVANSTVKPVPASGFPAFLPEKVKEVHQARKRSYAKENKENGETGNQGKIYVRKNKSDGAISDKLAAVENNPNNADSSRGKTNDILIKQKKEFKDLDLSNVSKFPVDDGDSAVADHQHSSASSLTRLRPDAFNFTWPVQEESSVVEGQIVLGALHMIHERSHDFVCGKVMEQGGIQALEAMLYTLDHVNGQGRAKPLIPGVSLGILAKDDCDTDILGLEQALEFIRGKRW